MRSFRSGVAIAAIMITASAPASASALCGSLRGLGAPERWRAVEVYAHKFSFEGFSDCNNKGLIIAECALHPRLTIDQAVQVLKRTKTKDLPGISMCGA